MQTYYVIVNNYTLKYINVINNIHIFARLIT